MRLYPPLHPPFTGKSVRSSWSTLPECQSHCAGLTWGSRGHQPELWMPRINTPQGQASQSHNAPSINYSEWQINVFHSSTLVGFFFYYYCRFSLREDKQQPVLSINMHYDPSNEQTALKQTWPSEWLFKKKKRRRQNKHWGETGEFGMLLNWTQRVILQREEEAFTFYLYILFLICSHSWSHLSH